MSIHKHITVTRLTFPLAILAGATTQYGVWLGSRAVAEPLACPALCVPRSQRPDEAQAAAQQVLHSAITGLSAIFIIHHGRGGMFSCQGLQPYALHHQCCRSSFAPCRPSTAPGSLGGGGRVSLFQPPSTRFDTSGLGRAYFETHQQERKVSCIVDLTRAVWRMSLQRLRSISPRPSSSEISLCSNRNLGDLQDKLLSHVYSREAWRFKQEQSQTLFETIKSLNEFEHTKLDGGRSNNAAGFPNSL
jgi:hypothetical protein